MQLNNNTSPYQSNNLPVSNLSESVEKNQFTNLYQPLKYTLCSYLNLQDLGVLASVNTKFKEIVCPTEVPKEYISTKSHRGYLCHTLVRRFLNDEIFVKLFGRVMNIEANMMGEFGGIVIDQNDLVDVNKKIRSFFSPIISQISNLYACKVYDKQSLTNRDLLEMYQLAKNPIFTKMFNLAFDIVSDTLAAMIDEFKDEELLANKEVFFQEIATDLKAITERSKAKKDADLLELQTRNLELKNEKVSSFANIHLELKNRVPEVDPIPDFVQVPVPVIAPVGAFSGLLAKARQFVQTPNGSLVAAGVLGIGLSIFAKCPTLIFGINGTNSTNV